MVIKFLYFFYLVLGALCFKNVLWNKYTNSSNITVLYRPKQERRNEFEGGGVNALSSTRIYSKLKNLVKVGGHDPNTSYGGAALGPKPPSQISQPLFDIVA